MDHYNEWTIYNSRLMSSVPSVSKPRKVDGELWLANQLAGNSPHHHTSGGGRDQAETREGPTVNTA